MWSASEVGIHRREPLTLDVQTLDIGISKNSRLGDSKEICCPLCFVL